MEPKSHDSTGAATDSFDTLISAFKAGKLVELLKGNGLTRATLEELLRPESAVKLKALLTKQVFAGGDDGDRAFPIDIGEAGPRHQPGQSQSRGKLLIYKAKETFNS